MPHWHAYEEVLTLIEGRVSIKLDEMTYELCAPTSIRIAPGMLHSLTNHVTQPARLLAYHATTAPKNEYPDGRPAPVQWEAD